jgi:hypothetical protein
MNYLRGFFIVIISALAMGAAGCTPVEPAGFTGGGGGGGMGPSAAIDSLLVVPHRSLYSVNDNLWRRYDFSVFAHYANNTMAEIPSETVEVGIIEDLTDPDTITPCGINDNPIFLSYGTKGVVVSYNNLSAQYTVQVLDPLGVGGDPGGGGGSGGNGPGIIITW